MPRILTTLLMLLAIAGTNVGAASAATYFGFPIGVINAPPPPRVVYTTEPRMEHMNHSRVMVMNGDDPGYDMFRYGSWYYMNNGDYWYRANSYRGPFLAVDARQVPRQVYAVPAEHWRHNPRFGGRDRMNAENRNRSGGRGHGHGNRNGNGDHNDKGDKH